MDEERQPARQAAAPVLLVDDTPAKLLTYEVMLEGVGATLIKASSAVEALSELRKGDVALIITDVSMPNIDGFEFAKMVREDPLCKHIPIIFVSAMAQSEVDQLQGYATGAVDYITVPIPGHLFRAKVKVFLDLFRQRWELEALKAELEQRVIERTAALEESTGQLALLVRELQHRTKNLLAVVQSIVSSTLGRSPHLETTTAALLGRLRALASAQDFVTSGAHSGVPLGALTQAQLAPFGNQVVVTGEDLAVGGSFAQTFALLVHELATNAAKYGALTDSQGRVRVRWTVNRSVDEPDFHFTWIEKGGPPPNGSPRPGFGTTLMTMHGRTSMIFAEAGLEYSLNLPLDEVLGKREA